MKTLPKNVTGALLAAWLSENYPELFDKVAARANVAGPKQQLAGFTDWLSSAGSALSSVAGNVASGLSDAVKNVGSFLASDEGAKTLSSLANAYGKVNSAILQTQVNRAQTGQAPAAIEMRLNPATGVYEPVYKQDGQQYPLNQSVLNSLQPSLIARYKWWIIGGAGALFLGYIILRKR